MKVCILSTVAPRQMSMYSIYTNYFCEKGITFDLIYFDLFNGEDSSVANETYRFSIDRSSSKIKRRVSYLSFLKFAKKIIIKNKYDSIIVWNEFTAVLFSNFLKKYYSKRYIVNIRDLFDERKRMQFTLLNNKLNHSIKFSLLTTIASPKYRDYLPKDFDYVVIHSLNENFEYGEHHITKTVPIRIMFIGKIRFLHKIKKFADLIGNDSRFKLIIAGYGSETMKEYSEKYNNIELIGSFKNEKTIELLNYSDILYNLYGTEYSGLRTALSQKLYLAISMRMPILVFKGTYTCDVAKQCGIGFDFDDDRDYEKYDVDELYNWYMSLDEKSIENKCLEFEKVIKQANEEFYKRIDNIFN